MSSAEPLQPLQPNSAAKPICRCKDKGIDNIDIKLIKYIYNLQILIKLKVFSIKDIYNKLLIESENKNKVNIY